MSSLSVGVVFGGRSVEHDVSIVTAHQMMEALEAASCNVVPIYVTREGRWLSAPGLNDLEVYRKRRWDEVGEESFIPPISGYGGLQIPAGRLRGPKRIPLDVVVPAIHGTFGEDGTLQGLLELADIPYTGSGVTGSAVGMDKVAMKASFRAAGLPVVPDVLVEIESFDRDRDAVVGSIETAIGYPAFVKPVKAGSSVGIGKATDRDKLIEAIDVARRYDRRLLVEKSMEGCLEVNCSVLGGPGREPRVSVCEQPVPWEEFLSFQDKYMRGGKHGASAKSEGMASQERRMPAPIPDALTKEVQENALKAFRSIDAAGVARVDAFVDEPAERTWVMEINTTPGSFSFYLWEASGLSFPELAREIVDIAIDTHRARSDLLFSFDSRLLESQMGAKSGG
jgi:D-alanine-D-alanine ligase